MTVFEQMLNVQEYGEKGGLMNLQIVRQEAKDHQDSKNKKKKEKEEEMTLLERMFFDFVKSSGTAVINQVMNEIFNGLNNTHW